MAVGYGIFSGGLDSILAAKLLIDQGIDVRLITFVTPFFGSRSAEESAGLLGLHPLVLDITSRHLEMMNAPKHGFGRFMNPCIDCHALMFQCAGEVMTRNSGDFLFSGEVLGQRPKSQNLRALNTVAKESGFADVILRPLSALVLPPTKIEQKGLVDRQRLLGLSGRSRKPQMKMANDYGFTQYPTPAGGCLLTDPIFSRRLAESIEHEGRPAPKWIERLKLGRHFRLPGGGKLVVGRNQRDNEGLENLWDERDILLRAKIYPGPSVLLSPPYTPDDVQLAAAITVSYSDAPSEVMCSVIVNRLDNEEWIDAQGRSKKDFAHLMV